MNVYLLGAVLFIIAVILSMFGKGGGEFYVPIFLTAGIAFNICFSHGKKKAGITSYYMGINLVLWSMG